MIIDTHIHLYDDKYKENIDLIIKEALEDEVSKLLVVGIDYETSLEAIRLAKTYPSVYAGIGLHPSEVLKETDLELSWLHELVKEDKVIAIGEVGLDYYWTKETKDLQIAYFIKQIEIANLYDLPLSIHSRDASLDTFNILKEHRAKAVLHCYSQSLELAREYVKLGYYLGIGGVVTFKNAKEIKRVVEEIPLEYLVVETDGPYLSPAPFRGKLNEPKYLKYIVAEISEIKKLTKEKVKNQLKENTYKLFRM